MPVTKRADGSYLVTVCRAGKRYRKVDRHWTYQDARAYERALIAQVRALARGAQPERRLGDGIARWLQDYVPALRSAQRTRWKARALLPYVDRKLSEIPQVWADVQRDLRGRASATINHVGRILRRIGNLAWREWGWLDKPPAIHLLTETPRERFLTRDEVEALASGCPDKRAGDYVLLAAYTGIRRGHLLRLTRHDVQDGYITLDRSGKTRKLQRVPVHPRVAEIAKRLPLGIGSRALVRNWDAAREATGIECRWHDLRHSFASWLVQASVPIYTVAELLGHSSVAVTKRYAHLAPQNLRDAIAKIPDRAHFVPTRTALEMERIKRKLLN